MQLQVRTASKKRRFMSPGLILVYMLVGLFAFVCLYPFLMVISGSLTSRGEAALHGFRLIPGDPTLAAYKTLFVNSAAIISGYKVTLFVTVVGTFLSLMVNSMMGYVLARKQMKFRKVLNFYVLFTMLFNGGMIPTYLLVNDLHMIDTFWALVIPNAMSAYNLFIMRNYFQSIPASLEESARIDGANPITILFRIILPISTPTLAAVGMFYGVSNWNAYLDGVLYINNNSLQILQVYLRNLFSSAGSGAVLSGIQGISDAARVTEETLKMVTISVSVIPILIVYPYLQKYYTTGITTGAVKG